MNTIETFQEVNIPAHYISGEYCICYTLGEFIVWGGETYSEAEAQQLAVKRTKATGLHFWSKRKELFGKDDPDL